MKTEPRFGSSVEHKAEFDNSSGICYGEPLDDKNPCTSLQVEPYGICSFPSVHSPNWLRLSSTYFDTSAMDSDENSFGSFVTDDVNFHELYNNSTNYNIPQGSAEEFGHLYPYYTNFFFFFDTDLVGMKGNLVHQDCESQLPKSCTKSSADVDNISTPCMLQMGEPGLAHFISRAKDGSINERFYDMHIGAVPDSTVKNRNIHQYLERKPADLASQQYNMTPDINASEIIYDSRGASNSCLSVPGNFMISAEPASKQSLVRGSSHDKDALLCGNNGAEARLFLFEDLIMCTLQG